MLVEFVFGDYFGDYFGDSGELMMSHLITGITVLCLAIALHADVLKISKADGVKADAYKSKWSYLVSATLTIKPMLVHFAEFHGGMGSAIKPVRRLAVVDTPEDEATVVKFYNACKGVYAVRTAIKKSKHLGCTIYTDDFASGGRFSEWVKAYEEFCATGCTPSNPKHYRYLSGNYEIEDDEKSKDSVSRRSAEKKYTNGMISQRGRTTGTNPLSGINSLGGIKFGDVLTSSDSDFRSEEYLFRNWLNGKAYWTSRREVARPFRSFKDARISATKRLRKIYQIEMTVRFPPDTPMYEKSREFEVVRDLLSKKLGIVPVEKSIRYDYERSDNGDQVVFDMEETVVVLNYDSGRIYLTAINKPLSQEDETDREQAKIERRREKKELWNAQKSDNMSREDLEIE